MKLDVHYQARTVDSAKMTVSSVCLRKVVDLPAVGLPPVGISIKLEDFKDLGLKNPYKVEDHLLVEGELAPRVYISERDIPSGSKTGVAHLQSIVEGLLQRGWHACSKYPKEIPNV